jgi:hypothetical protein
LHKWFSFPSVSTDIPRVVQLGLDCRTEPLADSHAQATPTLTSASSTPCTAVPPGVHRPSLRQTGRASRSPRSSSWLSSKARWVIPYSHRGLPPILDTEASPCAAPVDRVAELDPRTDRLVACLLVDHPSPSPRSSAPLSAASSKCSYSARLCTQPFQEIGPRQVEWRFHSDEGIQVVNWWRGEAR